MYGGEATSSITASATYLQPRCTSPFVFAPHLVLSADLPSFVMGRRRNSYLGLATILTFGFDFVVMVTVKVNSVSRWSGASWI